MGVWPDIGVAREAPSSLRVITFRRGVDMSGENVGRTGMRGRGWLWALMLPSCMDELGVVVTFVWAGVVSSISGSWG